MILHNKVIFLLMAENELFPFMQVRNLWNTNSEGVTQIFSNDRFVNLLKDHTDLFKEVLGSVTDQNVPRSSEFTAVG